MSVVAFHILLFSSILWITFAFNNIPIEIEKCKKGQWFVRNFIVFTCLNTDARRELKPFACDPNNGKFGKSRKRPVFLREIHKASGFIYECAIDKHTGAVVWKAIACYINDEKFGPGTFVKGRYDSVYLCYKDTDGILRIRMRKRMNSSLYYKPTDYNEIHNTTKAPIYEHPKIDPFDLLRSIKGYVNPEDVTLAPEPVLQPSDILV
ncbi:unnamed protein product [Strongylus vulgaris]|uniref:Uncharacterized protein n=1 Tax=Strongylus vulgaris TaxID=40348 RepID=A0A3P7IP79_STRVU|nr:unnamed protein product [Strongylus vulgaris]